MWTRHYFRERMVMGKRNVKADTNDDFADDTGIAAEPAKEDKAAQRARVFRTIDFSDPQLTPVEEAEICDTITDLRAAVKMVDTHAGVLKHGMERKSNLLNRSRLAQASRMLRASLDTVDAAMARLPFAALGLCLLFLVGCQSDGRTDADAPKCSACADGHCNIK